MPTTKTRAATATPMPASRGGVGAAVCGTPDSGTLDARDFFAWATPRAALPRAGRLAQADRATLYPLRS